MRALVLLMRIVVALSLAAMLQNRRADKQLTARIIAVILVLKLVSLVLALSLAAMLQNQRADKQLTVWIIAVILVLRLVSSVLNILAQVIILVLKTRMALIIRFPLVSHLVITWAMKSE